MDEQARILAIEKEIRETPYHKGTEHHIGLLRARVARLQDQILEKQSKGGGGGGGFAVAKAGHATVVLVGPPSAGKSSLLNSLTNAKSPVAPYSFTTVTVIPGMMSYQGAMIQIMDVPGLIEGAAHGKGRGREVLSVVRGADLIVFVAEKGQEDWFGKMEGELTGAGVRINQNRPKIYVDKKPSGGIQIRGSLQNIPETVLRQIFNEFGFKNAEIMLKEKLAMDELIDGLSQNRIFIPALYVVSKSDLYPNPDVSTGFHSGSGIGTTLRERVMRLSSKTGEGLEELRQAMWVKLKLARVFLARPGAEPDYDDPVIMRVGATLADVLVKLGPRVISVTHARISGTGSKFPNQQVSLTFPVQDGIVVTFE